METGWLRKTQWLVHKEQCPDCHMCWETFKRVYAQWCNKDYSRVLPEAKRIADKIKLKQQRR